MGDIYSGPRRAAFFSAHVILATGARRQGFASPPKKHAPLTGPLQSRTQTPPRKRKRPLPVIFVDCPGHIVTTGRILRLVYVAPAIPSNDCGSDGRRVLSAAAKTMLRGLPSGAILARAVATVPSPPSPSRSPVRGL